MLFWVKKLRVKFLLSFLVGLGNAIANNHGNGWPWHWTSHEWGELQNEEGPRSKICREGENSYHQD